jgi:hypothetical protein
MKRITILIFWLALALLATGCMTTIPKRTPLTAVSAPIPPTLPAPQPLPTGEPLLPLAVIQMPHTTLHGRPPFDAALTATLSHNLSQQLADCQQIIWEFGDGRRLSQSCPPPGEYGTTITAAHQYSQPDTYFVRVQMEMASGQVIESDKTQTVIVAEAQPVSWGGRLLYWLVWLGAVGLAGAAAFWLARRPRRQAVWGGALLFLALTAYLPPFSYLPDPLGLYWGLFGGHRYDPRLPFANRFVTRDDPTARLRPYLDGLIGQTGLDPLDPIHPLTSYGFIGVQSSGVREGRDYATSVAVRLTYANGERRVYAVPLYQPAPRRLFYQGNWRYDGLERLRTEHTAVPGIPFAPDNEALPPPQPIANSADPYLSGRAVLGSWRLFGKDSPSPPMIWSPDGESFLIARWHRQEWQTVWPVTGERFPAPRWVWPQGQTLWRVTLDGRPPQRIAANADQYGWSADGQTILYTTMDFSWTGERYAQDLYRVGLDGRDPEIVHRKTNRAWADARPDGIWFVAQGWLMQHDGQQLTTGASISLKESASQSQQMPDYHLARFNPAGNRIAYSCQQRPDAHNRPISDLCLQDRDGQNWTHIPLAAAQMELTWRPDGEQLAVVQWAYYDAPHIVWEIVNRESIPVAEMAGPPPVAVVLTILDRDGRILNEIIISDEGAAGPAQWLADGRRLLLPLYVWGGRRIILVNTVTGALTDLSRHRWDAEFSLHPDGRQLLLSNGRGLFWLTETGDTD